MQKSIMIKILLTFVYTTGSVYYISIGKNLLL